MPARVYSLRKTIIALLLISGAYSLKAQLIVDTNHSPQYLVQNVLLSNSIKVSNITYTGAKGAIGYFDGTHSNIGLANGVLMTTGNVKIAAGPNNTNSRGEDNNLPGDSALSAISGDSTFDACILQFDFIPFSDTVSFDFAFGSQEYPKYTCGDNDVFAFFISGPGITSTKNLAVIPGTTIPISINTVNGNCTSQSVYGGACCNSNSNYYTDNLNGTTVGYGGFTTVIKAKSSVICGQTYHIKIAIADGHDYSFDSGVFVGGHSFRGGTNPLNIVVSPSDSVCPNDKVTVNFPYNNPTNTYQWSFGDADVLSGSGNGPYVLSWRTSGPRQISLLDTGACVYNNDSITITVNACDVQVPNVFTPGSGDNNSTFNIINLEKYPYSNLQIFNRWGQQVYYSSDYHNDWNGSGQSDGTYFYILTLETHEVKKGFVTILRK
jgi:gliding motility-associated-like protein